MRLIHDLRQAQLPARSHLAIGVFDGIHRGHQRLITAMVEAAHATGDAAVVLTFDPHPATALGYEPPPLLTTVEERAEHLTALGLDVLAVLPFTSATVRTPAMDFVEVLTHHLHLAKLWAGPDFALGHQREGDIPFLRRLGAEWGFTVRVVEPVMWEGGPVSSSRIRAALEAGDISQATGCLGRPYRLTGVVTSALPTGGEVSFPPERLIPAAGTYDCLAHTERLGTHLAVVNICPRPIPDGPTPVVEARLLAFDGDLCDQTLAIDFITRHLHPPAGKAAILSNLREGHCLYACASRSIRTTHARIGYPTHSSSVTTASTS